MNTDDVTTGKSAEMKMDCPVCGGKGTATYTTQTHELAYFGEVVESTIQCERCGFRHNDVLATEQKDPAKHSLIITKKSLDSRICLLMRHLNKMEKWLLKTCTRF